MIFMITKHLYRQWQLRPFLIGAKWRFYGEGSSLRSRSDTRWLEIRHEQSFKGKIMRENARRELVTSSPLNATLACLLFAIFGIIHAYRSRCVYSSRWFIARSNLVFASDARRRPLSRCGKLQSEMERRKTEQKGIFDQLIWSLRYATRCTVSRQRIIGAVSLRRPNRAR